MRSIGRWSPNARHLGMSGGILLGTVGGNDCGDSGAKKSDSIQNRDDGAMTELLLGAVEFRKWSRNAGVSFQLVANCCTCVEQFRIATVQCQESGADYGCQNRNQ